MGAPQHFAFATLRFREVPAQASAKLVVVMGGSGQYSLHLHSQPTAHMRTAWLGRNLPAHDTLILVLVVVVVPTPLFSCAFRQIHPDPSMERRRTLLLLLLGRGRTTAVIVDDDRFCASSPAMYYAGGGLGGIRHRSSDDDQERGRSFYTAAPPADSGGRHSETGRASLLSGVDTLMSVQPKEGQL